MEERIDFIQELLLQAEEADKEKAIQVDSLRADQLLGAIAVLENQMTDVNELVNKENRLLEEYRSNELARLEKKLSWLAFNLDGFMRSTGQKTFRLPHGVLKLRKGKDRVAVVAIEQFLKIGQKLGLVKKVPESVTPDLQAILHHVHTTGEVLPGIQVISGEVKFSYSTNGGSTDDAE